MPATRIEPDLNFVNEVMNSGGDSLEKCYQCATCSVACAITPDKRPFPRKEMIWAQWGQKKKLLANPDVWLCHQCNDCSTQCPRGARPGDVLAAVRKQTLVEYSTPKFLARWLGKPDFMYILLLMVIPIFLLAFALALKSPLGQAFAPVFQAFESLIGREPHAYEGMSYASLFPHWLLIGFFSGLWTLSLGLGALGIFRFWKDMQEADSKAGNGSKTKGLTASIIKVCVDILAHNKFSGCSANSSRKWSHLGMFYGFIGLLIVTLVAIVILYMPGLDHRPYPFSGGNPVKIFGNISGLAMLVGCGWVIAMRFIKKDEAGKSTYFDWTFAWIVLGVVITGFLTQSMRFSDALVPGFITYFVHLVLVFYLLIYLPYSKFAHVLYRTAAMVYAEYTGRNEAVVQEPAKPVQKNPAKEEKAEPVAA